MTQIISISGKMQSGKNTCCNFILGHCLSSLGIVRDGFNITDLGQLYVNDIFGDKRHAGIFDIYNNGPKFQEFRKQHIDKYIKVYSYAYLLKKNICVDIMGLPYEKVFGTNDQKNELTEYRWKDMPGIISNEIIYDILLETFNYAKPNADALISSELGTYHNQSGLYMSIREVMQYMGTSIFRKLNSDIWTKATLRQIKEDDTQLALICDPRFPNEIIMPKQLGGLSIRLTRDPYPENQHESEIALNQENFDWDNFDFILDNKEMSISDQNMALYNIMTDLGLITGE